MNKIIYFSVVNRLSLSLFLSSQDSDKLAQLSFNMVFIRKVCIYRKEPRVNSMLKKC